MSREFPDRVHAWKAAEGRRTFDGTVPLSRMSRLGPLLDSTDGEAAFTAAFEFDEQRQATVHIEVRAGLRLVCQRSLEPYTERISRRSTLIVIEDMAEQGLLPENDETVLAVGGRLDLALLVEDELLLGMPQVPRNPDVGPVEVSTDGESPPETPGRAEPLQRPFSGLAGMLKENGQKGGGQKGGAHD